MKPCNEHEIVGLNDTYRRYYLKGYAEAEKEHNYHLKKIREEIEQMSSELTADGRRMIRRESVFRIIDKYLESEVKND